MTYPQYRNKHLEEALVIAKDFIKYKRIKLKRLPSDYVIIYHPELLEHFRKKYKGYKKIKISRHITIYKLENIGVVLMGGVGSPHAVMITEELIAMGGKRFVSVGPAGGLQDEGFFLCNKAIRDEGTSHHYLANGKYAYPNKELTEKLGKSLKKAGIKFSLAPTWTIDAPYRETKAEIEHYRKQGVATVEMETSALFTVGKIRNVKIAAAFIVSDTLKEKWESKFHHINVKRKLNKLLEVAVDCLRRK